MSKGDISFLGIGRKSQNFLRKNPSRQGPRGESFAGAQYQQVFQYIIIKYCKLHISLSAS